MANMVLFSKFDVRWGYNNIRIHEGNEWKAVFKTSLGLYEPLVMFFSMSNSPALFQAFADEIFGPLRQKYGKWFRNYMDNIRIGTYEGEKELYIQIIKDLLQI